MKKPTQSPKPLTLKPVVAAVTMILAAAYYRKLMREQIAKAQKL